MKRELSAFGKWSQHYSDYNKRDSWSAFALRGFDAEDPSFIIKPEEMSKRWKKENPERLEASCCETIAARSFPETMKLVDRIPAKKERVRMMRLAPKIGELGRHADITDRNAGTSDGKIARLHIPIVTDERCKFRTWSETGKESVSQVPVGSLWYLDVRKPHSVVNPSPKERIHLVVDVVCNEEIRKMIEASKKSKR